MTHPKRIMSIIGTRPEAIKMAPVVRALEADPRFESILCSTGQHKEMLAQITDWFELTPACTLDVMTPNQALATLASKLLEGLNNSLAQHKPDAVIVQGDTTTALIGALAAFYNRIPVAHVEAGLRTNNLASPFPEEGNRQLVARITRWHFAPTPHAANALFEENLRENVFVTGNTVIDALHETVAMLAKKPLNPLPMLAPEQRMVLITAHRRENYGDGFLHMCAAIQQLAVTFPEVAFVYPVHLNPNVRDVVHTELANIPNVHLVAPMDYPNFVATMQRATLILTDSGGVQEEAPSLGKPVLVMRDTTERPEAVTAGTVQMVGTASAAIVRATSDLLVNQQAYDRMANACNPYGDGQATRRILNLLAGDSAAENTFVTAAGPAIIAA